MWERAPSLCFRRFDNAGKRGGRLVVLTLLLVASLVTGCTQNSPRIPDAPTQTQVPTKSANYPLKVFRGCNSPCPFDDQLYIDSFGGVLVQVKGRMVECQLDKASLAALNNAALVIKPTSTQTVTPTGGPGAAIVSFGTNDGVLDINDERIVKVKPVIEQLLEDVYAPAANRKICT